MNQYTNTILHIPEFQVTEEATVTKVETAEGIQVTETIHGKVTSERRGCCPHCGDVLHIHQHLHVQLHHLTIGNRKILLDVGFEQYLCIGCKKTVSQEIPFKAEHHMVTKAFTCMVKGFLDSCDMSIKGLSLTLKTNSKLVKEVDKNRLKGRYGDMLPTHVSEHLCVDEFLLHKGHHYATVVLDWQTGEILFLEAGNSERQLLHFFEKEGRKWMLQVKSISMDMNAQYCKAVKALYPHIAIVYDGFHIIKNFNDRILTGLRRLEQNRLQEAEGRCRQNIAKLRVAVAKAPLPDKGALEQELREEQLSLREVQGKYAALKGSRYVITSSREALQRKDELAREHNRHLAQTYEVKGLPLPPGERKWSIRNVQRLDQVLGANENLNLAFFLGDQLKAGLESTDEQEMREGLEQWLLLSQTYVAQIPMLASFNKMIRDRMEGIVARVKFPTSNGPLEGCNTMIKTVRRQAYGYRDMEYFFLKLWDRSRRYIKNRDVAKVKEKRIQAQRELQKSHRKIS